MTESMHLNGLGLIFNNRKLLFIIASIVVAVSICANETFTITSDTQSGSEEKGMVFSGNVVFDFESINIKADTLQIKREEQGIVQLVAKGGVNGLTVIQLNAETAEQKITAEAQQITYVHETGKLVLEGKANLREGSNQISAHLIRYNTQTREFSAEKGSNVSRVTTRMQLSP